MGDEWLEVPLSSVYDFRSGLSKPATAFGSGYPFLSFKTVFSNFFLPKELNERVETTEQERDLCSIKRGDIFLTRTSETLHELGMSSVALQDYENATFNGFSKRLRPKQGVQILPEYAGYYFRSPKFRQAVTSMSSPSTRASLNEEMLGRLTIVLPPVEEQIYIAKILKSLDDKIELNRKMNERLEAMARALFKSWFVDFDPVRAKMEGRDTGLPKEIVDLFPDEYEDSELGEIPKGWRVGCLGEEFIITMGQSPPGETYNDIGAGLPFYQGRADFGFRYPKQRVFCTAPKRFAHRGDTLVSVRAPVGDINMALEECAIGRGVAAVMHRSRSRGYSFQFMRGIEDVFAKFEAEGTVFGSINKADFNNISCVIPPESMILFFEQFVRTLDDRVENADLEIQTLSDTRNLLLPKLITGELRVPDAEKIVEAVS